MILAGQKHATLEDCGAHHSLPCVTPCGCRKHRQQAVKNATARAARIDANLAEKTQKPLEALGDLVFIHHNVKNLETKLVQNLIHPDAAAYSWPEANVPTKLEGSIKGLLNERTQAGAGAGHFDCYL